MDDPGTIEALDRLGELNRKLSEITIDPSMFSQIVDALPDGLIVINEVGRVFHVNRMIEIMFGYHRSKLVGEPVHMLLEPKLTDVHARHLERFFAAPSARPMNLAAHLHGRHSSGRTITVQISIAPLISEVGVFGLALVRRVAGAG